MARVAAGVVTTARRAAQGLAVAALVAVAGSARALLRVEVEGSSMLPTLAPGDHVLAWRRGRIRPGDLVVAVDPRAPARLVVKRAVVVGPAGLVLRGDNPAASTDSRRYGPVPASRVVGRVLWCYEPPPRRRWLGWRAPGHASPPAPRDPAGRG